MKQSIFTTKVYRIFGVILTILLFLSGFAVDIFALYVAITFGVPTIALGVVLFIFLFVGFAMLLVATSMLHEIRKEIAMPPMGYPIYTANKLED